MSSPVRAWLSEQETPRGQRGVPGDTGRRESSAGHEPSAGTLSAAPLPDPARSNHLLLRPAVVDPNSVAALRPAAADRDQLEAVRPGVEAAHDRGADADHIPSAQLERVVVELDSAGAANDDVGLLLRLVPLAHGRAG